MTDINKVVEIGNITRDIGDDERSFSYTNNGTARANFSIAVNRSVKKGEEWIDEVSYFDVTVWGKTAENLKPYFTKGQKVAVEGYLKQDRWEKDGQKFSKVGIVAEKVQLVGNRKAENDGGNPSYSDNNAGNSLKPKQEVTPDQAFDGGFPEDVPFWC